MTYDEALKEAKTAGVSRCSDQAFMASFLNGNARLLLGAVSPRLIWEGAVATGIGSKEMTRLVAAEPEKARDLMWGIR